MARPDPVPRLTLFCDCTVQQLCLARFLKALFPFVSCGWMVGYPFDVQRRSQSMRSVRKRWQRREMNGKTVEKERINCLCTYNVVDSVLFQENSILCRGQSLAHHTQAKEEWLAALWLVSASDCVVLMLVCTSHCRSCLILLGPRAYLRGISAINSLQRNSF